MDAGLKWFMDRAQEIGDKCVEFASQCIERFIGILGLGFGKVCDKCSELGSSIKQSCKNGIESLRPSPSPSPSLKKEPQTQVDMAPVRTRSVSPNHEVQTAVAGIKLSPLVTAGLDLGNASVGMDGVGCASTTYARYNTQSMQLTR